MAEAFLTPHLLTWARQRRGLEVEDLAKKLNVKPDAVNAQGLFILLPGR